MNSEELGERTSSDDSMLDDDGMLDNENMLDSVKMYEEMLAKYGDVERPINTIHSECLSKYGPGKFHPVYIGEIYKEGRYKIEQKLGWGAHSTVWGARDLHDDKFVAIKVLSSEKTKDSKELQILQRLRNNDLEHPGREHVLQLLDYFYHDGVNGHHLFIVTESLGQTLYDFVDHKWPRRLDGFECRLVCRQLLLAVDFMQKCGVVHAELHSANIMLPLPEYCYYDEPDIAELPRDDNDSASLVNHQPTHMVGKATTSIDEDKKKDTEFKLSVKVVDFSSSFFADEFPTSASTTKCLQPPEMVFKKPLTKAFDVWQLACITYWIASHQDLFRIDRMSDVRNLIPQIYSCIGESSANWLLDAMIEGTKNKLWETVPKPIGFDIGKKTTLEEFVRGEVCKFDEPRDRPCKEKEEEKAEGSLNLEESLEKREGATSRHKSLEGRPEVERYITMLARYLRRMLVVDPDQRPTAEELLTEAFVQDMRLDNYEVNLSKRALE